MANQAVANQPSPSPSDMRRAYDALGIACPITNNQPGPAGGLLTRPANRMVTPEINQPPMAPNVRLMTPQGQQGVAVTGAGTGAVPGGQMVPNVSLPLSSDPTNTALPVTSTASTTVSAAQQQTQAIQQTMQNIFALNDSQSVVRNFQIFLKFLIFIGGTNKFFFFCVTG